MSVSIRQIAFFTKHSEKTVRRWCEGGRIKGAYRTKGGHWRIHANGGRDAHEVAVRSRLPRKQFQNFDDDGNDVGPTFTYRPSTRKKPRRVTDPGEKLDWVRLLATMGLSAAQAGTPIKEWPRGRGARVLNSGEEEIRVGWERPDEAKIFTAVVELRLNGVAATQSNLARQMKRSRRSVVRDYSLDRINRFREYVAAIPSGRLRAAGAQSVEDDAEDIEEVLADPSCWGRV